MAGKFMKTKRVCLLVLLLFLASHVGSDSSLSRTLFDNPDLFISASQQEVVLQIPDTGENNLGNYDNPANLDHIIANSAKTAAVTRLSAVVSGGSQQAAPVKKISADYFKNAYKIILNKYGMPETAEERKTAEERTRQLGIVMYAGQNPGYYPTDEEANVAFDEFKVNTYISNYFVLFRAPYDLNLREGPGKNFKSIGGVIKGQLMYLIGICKCDYAGWVKVRVLYEGEDGKLEVKTGYVYLTLDQIRTVLYTNDCTSAMLRNKKTGEVILADDPRVDELIVDGKLLKSDWELVVDIYRIYPNGRTDKTAYLFFIKRLSDTSGIKKEVLEVLVINVYPETAVEAV